MSLADNSVKAKVPSSSGVQFYRRPLPQECISFCSDEGNCAPFYEGVVGLALSSPVYRSTRLCLSSLQRSI